MCPMRKDQNPVDERWLPYEQPVPKDERVRPIVKAARVAAYVVVLGAIVTSMIQVQYITHRNASAARKYDMRQAATAAAARDANVATDANAPTADKRPKEHAGAMARWAKAVRLFWAGENIYREFASDEDDQEVWLHPNTPFVVILLTPLAYLSPDALAAALNVLKLLALLAAGLWGVRVVNHGRLRMPDWVVLLGVMWAVPFLMGDIRHGNTNTFVLAFIVLHLWLYRRGRDVLAGGSLALAICLKMTPALFVLYWLYQRSWKVLAATLASLTLFMVVIPAAAVGPQRYTQLMQDWGTNLIQPGLVKGDWYPIHINQSLPAVVGRYLMDGASGNIMWNPDDNPYEVQKKFAWINVVSLQDKTVKAIVRLLQALLVLLMAWAIGWRRLPRDDGRRGLHYAMVVAAILLLNQRTWDHHATILLIGDLAVWYAIAFGRVNFRARLAALIMMIAAGATLAAGPVTAVAARLAGHAKDAELWADVVDAYGPAFAHFLLVYVSAVVLAISLRRVEEPYAPQRQKLSRA